MAATNDVRCEKINLWIGVLFLGLALLIAPPSASAHAELLESSIEDGARLDESPGEIVLSFTESVGLVDGGTVLHAGASDPVALLPEANGVNIVIPIRADLPDGSYLVQWRVISNDGHPIAGIVRFTIGIGGGEIAGVTSGALPGWVGAMRMVATAAKYMGLLGAAGTLMVGRVLAPTDWQSGRRLASTFGWLALLGVMTELPLIGFEQRGSVTGGFGIAVRNLDSTTLLTSGLCIAATVCSIMAMARTSPNAWYIASSFAVLGLLSQLVSGHTRSKEPTWLMMTADAVHLSAAAMWLGGILILAVGLTGRWNGEAFITPAQASSAVSRFSTIAMYNAVAVIAAGTVMAVTILRSWDALVGTDYGVSLLIKIGVVVLVMMVAALNRWLLIPRTFLNQPDAIAWLKRLVLVELVLLVAVGGVTARLVDQDPNAGAAVALDTETVLLERELALDNANILNLLITAESNGLLHVKATLTDSEGALVVVESGLQLEWNMTQHGIGPIHQVLDFQESFGDYRGELQVPMTGRWEVTIRARIDRFDDSRATVEIIVPD